MNKRVCWVSIIALLAGLLLPGLLYAGETTTTPATVKMTVIKPGKADRCQTDFIVENIDREPADLKVVLGNKVYVDEMLAPSERRAFSLPGTILTARYHGHEVKFDEVAVIINLGPTSNMRLRCIQLPDNPVDRQNDELTVFK